jgi:hypothetical protein
MIPIFSVIFVVGSKWLSSFPILLYENFEFRYKKQPPKGNVFTDVYRTIRVHMLFDSILFTLLLKGGHDQQVLLPAGKATLALLLFGHARLPTEPKMHQAEAA